MLGYFTLATLWMAASHAYIGWSLTRHRTSPNARRRVWSLLAINVACVPATMVLTLRAPAAWASWSVPLARAAFADVGLALLLVLALATRDAVSSLTFALTRTPPVDPSRRRALGLALDGLAFVTAGGAAIAGAVLAAEPPVVTRVRIVAARVPAGWTGMRIAQVSDLHVGPTIRREYVRAIVEQVRALRPDVVVVTGDLVDGFVAQLREQLEPLRALAADHRVYFITGNHEYFYRANEWVDALTAMGLRVLSNAHDRLDHAGASVLIAGVDDPASGAGTDRIARAVRGAPVCDLRVLLAHRPADVHVAAAHGIDVQLSGHLHGGQFFPLTTLLRATEPYLAGLFRVRDTSLFVSRGAGYWGPPNRLGARSEIALIEIVPT